MAIAVDAQPRQRPEIVEALSDSSDDLFADARVLLLERLGYETAGGDQFARLHAHAIEVERRPVLETRRGRRCA